jgi:FAD/FMN-containing dehydrogenase
MGWLSRKAGLSCDNLLSVQLVTAEGAIVRASAQENPELFWAVRGGGGNFGVVTEFEFRLHEVGPMVQLALSFWDLENGPEAFRAIRDQGRDLPEDIAIFLAAGGAFTRGQRSPPSSPSAVHIRHTHPVHGAAADVRRGRSVGYPRV